MAFDPFGVPPQEFLETDPERLMARGPTLPQGNVIDRPPDEGPTDVIWPGRGYKRTPYPSDPTGPNDWAAPGPQAAPPLRTRITPPDDGPDDWVAPGPADTGVDDWVAPGQPATPAPKVDMLGNPEPPLPPVAQNPPTPSAKPTPPLQDIDPGAPAALDLPPGFRPRTGGEAIDTVFGDQAGMVPGEKAYEQKYGRPYRAAVEGAHATPEQQREWGSIAEAEDRLAIARDNLDKFRGESNKGPLQGDTFARKSALERDLRLAEQAVNAAKKRPIETQTGLRSKAETGVETAVGSITSSANAARGVAESLGGGELSPRLRDRISPERAKRLEGNKEAFGDLVAPLKGQTDELDKWAGRMAKPDPAQAEDFSSKLTAGGVSMATFMAGGLAARTLRLPQFVGSGGFGALQMGGTEFKQVENEIAKVKASIEAAQKDNLDTTKEEARLKELEGAKYLSLYANAGLGATEAIPIERFLHRLNQQPSVRDRVAHIFDTSVKQSLEEILQEVGQQIGTDLVAKLLWDHQREVFNKETVESGEIGGILGLFMGFGAGVNATRGARATATSNALSGAQNLPPLPSPLPPVEANPTSTTAPLAAAPNPPSAAAPPPGPPAPGAANLSPQQSPQSGAPSGAPTSTHADAQDLTDITNLPAGAPTAPVDAATSPEQRDDEYDRAVAIVRGENKASTSYIQRKLGLGYNRAAALVERMEREGVVGPPDHAGKREVLPEKAAGTREAPVEIKTPEDVAKVGEIANQTHSHAQGEANNIQRGHAEWGDEENTFGVTIEAPANGVRRGVAPDGTQWEQKFTHAYGYLKGIKGNDGKELDAYVMGEKPQVFVMDELDGQGGFRQHKVFLGAEDSAAAKEAYLGTQDKKPDQWGGGRMMTAAEFKQWTSDPKNLANRVMKKGHLANFDDEVNRTLRAYGYDQFSIDRMGLKERLAEFEDARAAGVTPEESPSQDTMSTFSPSKEGEKIDIDKPSAETVAKVEDAIRSTGHPPEAFKHLNLAQDAAAMHAWAKGDLTEHEAIKAAVVRGAMRDGEITEDQARRDYGDKIISAVHAYEQQQPGLQSAPSGPATHGADAQAQGGKEVGPRAAHDEAPRPGGQARGGGEAARPGQDAGHGLQQAAKTQPGGKERRVLPWRASRQWQEVDTLDFKANGAQFLKRWNKLEFKSEGDKVFARIADSVKTANGEAFFNLMEEEKPERVDTERQFYFPGTARISAKELADRKVAEPKRAPQRGMRGKSRTKEIEGQLPPGPPPDGTPPPAPAPMSAMMFLASRGGIQPTAELINRGIDYRTRVVVPGMGWRSVIHKSRGMTMTEAWEVLIEGKYLPNVRDDRPSDSDIEDQIVEMLSEEHNHKRPTFPMGAEAAGLDERNRRNTEIGREQLAALEQEVRDYLDDGTDFIKHLSRPDHFIRRAATIMSTEGLDAGAAFDLAVMREQIDEEGDAAAADFREVLDLGDIDDILPAISETVGRTEPPRAEEVVSGEGPDQSSEVEGDSERPRTERPREAASGEGQRIVELAVRDSTTGRIWQGKSVHADLGEDAAKDLGISYDDFVDRAEDGYITDTGRFVDRKQAASIATAAGQTKGPVREDDDGEYLSHDDLREDALEARPQGEEAQAGGADAAPAARDDEVRAVPEPTTEKTAAGVQTVLPGTEKVSDAELAKRKIRQPLKPKAAQKLVMDEGLFGDTSQQDELFAPNVGKSSEPAEKQEQGSVKNTDLVHEPESGQAEPEKTGVVSNDEPAVSENKAVEAGPTLHGRPVRSDLDAVLAEVESGAIKQREDKERFCYPSAGQAAIDGTFDYVIGLVNTREKPVYHGLITTTDGGVTYYADTTLTTDAWFPENVFKQLVGGFVLVHQMHAGEVKGFGARTGKWADPSTLGLPSIAAVMQHVRAGTEIPRSKHPNAGIWASRSVKETPAKTGKNRQSPATGPETTGSETVSAPISGPLDYEVAVRKVEQARSLAQKLQADLDKMDERLARPQQPGRNALDQERLDKNREIAERNARNLRKKVAEAWDALEDAQKARNALKESHNEKPQAPAETKPAATAPADTKIPEFLKRTEKSSTEKAPETAENQPERTSLKPEPEKSSTPEQSEAKPETPGKGAIDDDVNDAVDDYIDKLMAEKKPEPAPEGPKYVLPSFVTAQYAKPKRPRGPRPSMKAEGPPTPKQIKEMPVLEPSNPARTASDAAKSAAKNVSQATSDALKGLDKLFNPKSKFTSGGISFDEETWAAAKPFFLQAAKGFANAYKDIGEFARILIDELRTNFGWEPDALDNARPYLKRFVQEVKDGSIDLTTAPEAPTSEQEGSDERTGPQEPGPGAPGEPPTERGGTPQEGGDSGRCDTGAGGERTDGNRPPDEPGLPGDRGDGDRAGTTPAKAGAGGRGRAGVGAGGARGNGARVPSKSPGAKGRRGERRVTPEQAPSLPAINFRITSEVELGKGGEAAKFNDNIAAIETLKTVEREQRRATPEEQRILARYVGWGGLANAFRQPETQEFKPDWSERGERLEGALNREELRQARSSTQYAHYTSKTVIDAMWSAVKQFGFRGGIAVETSAGVGNFLGLIPEELAGQTKFVAVEKDSVSARIAKLLYPQETVLNSPFENVPLPDGEASLVIGNPPFSSHSLSFKNKPELTGLSMHNQFILAGLDALRPGGIQVVVVSRYLMDAQDPSAREKMAAKAKLLGAIRLPDTAFKENARTEVVTDILFFQRRTAAEETEARTAIEDANSLKNKGTTGGAMRKAQERRIHYGAWMDTEDVRDPLGGAPMRVNWYFARLPRMVVGRLERSGTMHMAGEEGKQINVRFDGDFAPRLAEAIGNLPSNVVADQHDAVIKASIERHDGMSASLQIAIAGSEVGHVERTPDGKLTQITERETPSGEYELTRRDLSPSAPWSRQLSMDKDGRWYVMEAAKTVDIIQQQIDDVRKRIKTADETQAVSEAAVLRQELETLYDRKSKTKSDELAKSGKRNIYVRQYFENNEVPPSMRLGDTKYEKLVDAVNLRDLTKQQLQLEADDAPVATMEGNRKRLAAAYREFVDKHGLLNEARNTQLINDLPDGAIVLALEHGYRQPITAARAARTGEKVRAASASPAPIMSRRVVPRYDPPTRAASPADAVSIALSERGALDMERIASLLGTNVQGAADLLTEGETPLAYFDPETKRYEPRAGYLSGQVAKKLAAARAAGLDKNATDLAAVQPEKWTAENVTAIIGNNWIPPKVYVDFLNHLLGARATVHYSAATNSFNVIVSEYAKEKQDQWGTDGMPADAIVRGMLNSRVPKVTHTDQDGTTRVDAEATALVQLKAREIENEFGDWVFKDVGRRNHLVEIYNEKFNTRVTRQHDGSHLKLPGKVPDEVISLRRHQKNAVWRGIYERFMLLDHVVGAGKTFTAIARAMERRRMGLSRKPTVVVPNHLVEQWTADVYRLYPGAKVLAAGKNQFDRKNRRRLFARIATGDWDLVIVPHSSFGFIGIDPATEIRFLEQDLRIAIDAVREAQEQAAADGLGGRIKPFTVKQAEALVETIQGRLDKLKTGHHDRMLTFEQMGIDDLTVDEAHEFKNLFYSSRLTGVRGMGDKAGSKKAFDLYNKVRVLRESPTGTVTFMTGTPISNSAVEMFTMMRYLAAQDLKDLGVEHFDAWRTQSVSAEARFEPTESGGLKEVTRLGRSWSNMRALMELSYSFTDAVSQDDINKWYAEDNAGARFPVPKVKGGGRQEVIVQPTPAQENLLRHIVAAFNDLPRISDAKERNIARLKLMDVARKVSLDIRAADPRSESKEEGGKLDQIADNVTRIYKATTADRGTQLVFLDRSVKSSKSDGARLKEYDDLRAKRDEAIQSGDEARYRELTDKLDEFDHNEMEELRLAQRGGWNAYDQLKDNLVKRGIPADQIRFVQEANNDAEKKALFDLVKEGSVRVLIGSTPRMGAGTNVQDRLVALHHADVTWKPSDIEQREGRIIRQGNTLLDKYGEAFEVEILAYATERTVDAKMWDLNATKLRMINGIRKYDGAFNMEFDDEEAVGMAEIAALASGDPLLLERVKLMAQIDKLELIEKAYRRRRFGMEDQIHDMEKAVRDYPAMIETGRKKAATIQEGIDVLDASVAKRAITIEGKSYTDIMSAVKAATDAVELAKGGDENARYSINVGGARLTNKEAIQEAISNEFGDNAAFEVRHEGETWRRRTQLARELGRVATNAIYSFKEIGNQAGGRIGTMLGSDLNWAASRGNYGDIVSLWLERDGVTLAEMERSVPKTGKKEDFSTQAAKSLVDEFTNRVRVEAGFTGEYLQRRINEATARLPQLREDYAKSEFPQAAEIAAARQRLADVIRILDERTKAAEGRGGGDDGPLGPEGGATSANELGTAVPDEQPPLSAEQRKQIVGEIEKIVRFIAGPIPGIQFFEGTSLPEEIPIDRRGWGNIADREPVVLGRFHNGIIQLALQDPDIHSTAVHESYHHIEAVLQSQPELALMTSPREMARMREVVQRFRPDWTAEDVAGLAGYEVRAIAFQAYAEGNANAYPVHIGVRRFWEKLLKILRAARNMLQGMGFKTAEDIFGKALSGGYRKQPALRNFGGFHLNLGDRPLGPDESAAARGPARAFRGVTNQPRLPQAMLTPLHTSVRAALNDPTLSRGERRRQAMGALFLPHARALWDKLIDIDRLQRAAQMFRGTTSTPQRFDTLLAASIYPGRTGERLKDMSHDLFAPIYDAMAERGISEAELNDFLYARHAEERNVTVGMINQPGTQFRDAVTNPSIVGASGMSTDEANSILMGFAVRRADFDAVAALVDHVTAWNRDLMEREGLEHISTLTTWANTYRYYVPLKGRDVGAEDEHGTPPRGLGFMVRGPESQRALGRKDRAGNILAHMLDQTMRTIVRAEKNKVGKTFARFAVANPSDLYKIGLANVRRAINPNTGLVELQWVTTPAQNDRAFAYKIAGDTHYIEFAEGQEDGLLAALKNLGAPKLKYLGGLMKAMRAYSAFQTAKNPEFVFTNLVRDIQDAGVALTAEQQAGFATAYLNRLLTGRSILGAVLGMSGRTNTVAGQLYEDWRHDGGKISVFGWRDIDEIQNDIRRELARRNEPTWRTAVAQPWRTVDPLNGHVVRLFETLSDVTETTTRLAVYGAALDVGLSRAQAAAAARAMTVDFSRGGTLKPVIQALWAFANPAILGSVNLVRRLVKSRQFRWLYGAAIPSLSFMLTLYNMWAAPADDDDKDKKIYEEMKYWDREKNIFFFVPGQKNPITIPLGFLIKPAWMMGENAAMAALGKISPTKALGQFIGSTVQAFNPFGTDGSAFDWRYWVKNISPTFLDPMIELGFNRNWNNQPIHPDEQPWAKGKPHSEQSKMTTGQTFEDAAQWINRMTGGSTFSKGAVDLYPDDLEYAWNFLLGGYGKFMMNGYNMLRDQIDGIDTPVEKMPFVRRFVREGMSEQSRREDYYETRKGALEKAQSVRDAIRAQRQGNNTVDAQHTIDDLADKVGARVTGVRQGVPSVSTQAETTFRRSDRELSRLRAEERRIRHDPNLNRRDRNIEIRANRKEQLDVMKDPRQRWRELREQP